MGAVATYNRQVLGHIPVSHHNWEWFPALRHWLIDRHLKRKKAKLIKALRVYLVEYDEYYLISVLWDELKRRDYEDNDATRYANLDDQLVAVALQKGKFPANHPIMNITHEKV